MKYPQKHMMEAIRQITKIGTVIAVTAYVLGRIQHNTISATKEHKEIDHKKATAIHTVNDYFWGFSFVRIDDVVVLI